MSSFDVYMVIVIGISLILALIIVCIDRLDKLYFSKSIKKRKKMNWFLKLVFSGIIDDVDIRAYEGRNEDE